MPRVFEVFEKEYIPVSFIGENFEGPYWEKCDEFITDVWRSDVSSLTGGQSNWMDKILDDCIEKRIDG